MLPVVRQQIVSFGVTVLTVNGWCRCGCLRRNENDSKCVEGVRPHYLPIAQSLYKRHNRSLVGAPGGAPRAHGIVCMPQYVEYVVDEAIKSSKHFQLSL